MVTSRMDGNRAQDHPLGLNRELFGRLNELGVRYCHWKSNDRLGEALSGGTDLDILVERTSFLTVLEEITRLGFRLAAPPGGEPVVAATHYYGLDKETGRLITLHLHVHLVVGIDLSKNFRLSKRLETAYFDSAFHEATEGPGGESEERGLLPIPTPDIDYTVLVVRLALKHHDWSLLFAHKGRLSKGAKFELEFLRAKVDADAIDRARQAYFPEISDNLFRRCEASFRDEVSGLERMRTRWAVERALEAHALRPLWQHRAAVWKKMALIQWGALTRKKVLRKQPLHTGLLVAVVGGDGSGKSTAVENVQHRMGKIYDVRQIHLGRPPASLITRVLAHGAQLTAKNGLTRLTEGTSGFPGGLRFLLSAAVARDRLRLVRSARRAVNAGTLVLSDRFPNSIQHLADSPAGARLAEGHSPGFIWNRIRDYETECYASFPEPDLLIVLRVPPETAVERVALRSPEEDAEGVRRRSREVYEADWSDLGAVVVDGSQSVTEVQSKVQSLIWERV